MTTNGNVYETLLLILEEAGFSSEYSQIVISSLQNDLAGDFEACLAACRRIAAGEPLAYVLGHQPFYREDYYVNSAVLIPRPDTELLVETALQYCGACEFPMGDVIKINKGAMRRGDDLVFADFCTGSGCVGISVINQLTNAGYDVTAYLSDISSEALEVCNKNLMSQLTDLSKEASFIKVINCDLKNENKMRRLIAANSLDFIVSNPPYITSEDMGLLERSVADYEPTLALYGGNDGLDFYKILAEYGKIFLKNGAPMMVEHGYDQGEAVREIFIRNGYIDVVTLKDYGGNDRVCFAGTP